MKAERADCYHEESFREIGLWFKSPAIATTVAYDAPPLQKERADSSQLVAVPRLKCYEDLG